MVINTQIDGDKATLFVDGRLAIDTATDLDNTVRELPEDVKNIEIDLSRTSYVSSAGLRVFVNANKLALTRGGSFVVSHPVDEVMDVLSMTGIVDLITVVQ